MSAKSAHTTPQSATKRIKTTTGNATTTTPATATTKKNSSANDETELFELIDLLKPPTSNTETNTTPGSNILPSISSTNATSANTGTARKPPHGSPNINSSPSPSGGISNSLSDPSLGTASPGLNSMVLPVTTTANPSTATPGRKRTSKNIEETRLDAFLLKHSKRYEFTNESYSKLLASLVDSRLLNIEWEKQASREHRLRVLRAIRVLSRDANLQDQFLRAKPLNHLSNILSRYTKEYFETDPPYTAESIVEVCSILKRISTEESQDRRIFEQTNFLRSLVLLLSSKDHAVLQAVLVTLVNLSGSSMFVEKAMELPLIEPLLNILNEFSSSQGPASTVSAITPTATHTSATPSRSNSSTSVSGVPATPPVTSTPTGIVQTVPPTTSTSSATSSTAAPIPSASSSYHFLAGELLDLLTEYKECRLEIHLLSGNAVFLRLLHRSIGSKENEPICLPVLRCIANQALEPSSSREIRLLGGIQLLLGILNVDGQPMTPTNATAISSNTGGSNSTPNLRPSTSTTTTPSVPTVAASDAMLISACICLTQLALDDENAFHMRKSGAIYLLGMLFLHGSTGEPAIPNTSATPPHRTYSRDVQSHALRALRFLYSVERNRKIFKRLFPLPDLFASFIDIGHYVHAIEPYEPIVDQWNEQSASNKQSMLSAFESLRSGSLSGQPPQIIRGYIIQEILGKGAFGTVYQVQRENGDKLYAMKELSLKELQKSLPPSQTQTQTGANEAVKLAANEMGKEVEILSQLDHPNIVRYYTSFLEGPSVYIVMELVVGSSLLDHINSWIEKGQLMAEEAIWPIFIQLCLALCYMHMEKRVVHRDLTPSNIMINDKKVVKIADFGLARQTHNGTVLQSAVGTISFSCPEIVMHESYTDKADIWSLGCILYQMATGKPAFAGSNPLTVAQKIVSGSYTPLPSSYSPLFHEMVRRLLTVDPHQRPDILAVSSLISPLLMAELDRVNISHDRLNQQLFHEQERHRREKEEWMREKQIWRKWMAAQASNNKVTASGAVSPAINISRSQSGGNIISTGPPGGPSASSIGMDDDDPSVSGSLHSLQPPSSSPLFRVSTSQLRPPSQDPLTTLLTQLHKLIYVTQLPPKSTRDLKRTVIGKYKYALFARTPFQPGELKRELLQIVSGSQDPIDPTFELPHLDAATLSSPHTPGQHLPTNSPTTINHSSQSRLTHEELQLMIEQVLEEVGYYTQNNNPSADLTSAATSSTTTSSNPSHTHSKPSTPAPSTTNTDRSFTR